MPIDLNRPLRWKTANALEASMIEDLQGNILKGHGRDHTRNLFVLFGGEAESRRLVSLLGGEVTTAAKQLKDSDLYRGSAKEDAPAFIHLVLKASAYKKLGVEDAATPRAKAFRDGMRARAGDLLDPDQPKFDPECDALLIIGAHTSDAADTEATRLRMLVEAHGGAVPHTQPGRALRNSHKDGIEHFGYVDGRSQPLMLCEDVEWERDERGGTSRWDPAFGPGLALVPDPGGHRLASYGSYFVFRKLEQDVDGFKKTEQAMATTLGLGEGETQGSDEWEEARELAGALVVGRFEDGTAVVMSHEAEDRHPVWNNFNYDSDPDGITCPFASHIRKVNPRGDSVGRSHGTIEEERAHLFPRRGITYDDRPREAQFALPSAGEADDPGWMAEAKKHNAGRAAVMEGATEEETGSGHGDFPSKEVGLLFMCYNANIEHQFEFMQKSWANDPDYVKPGTGFDPIMGQGEGKLAQTWPAADGTQTSFGFGGFVRMLGGDYFFAPSISFLKGLAGV